MHEPTSIELPPGVLTGNENLIQVTESAGRKIKELISREKQGDMLRVAVSGGGCNGLSYGLRFVKDWKRGDILVQSADARLLVDSKSALYLKGTKLDYSASLISGGFKFSNPNASSTCSCGESFSI